MLASSLDQTRLVEGRDATSPTVPSGRPRSLKQLNAYSSLGPGCMACSQCYCPSEKSEVGMGDGGQGRLPAGDLVGVKRAKPRAHKLKCVFKAGFHSTHSQDSFSARFFSFQRVLLCSMHMNPLFLMSMYFQIFCPSLQ